MSWYREPWPWILMSGPAAVMLAGAFTTALAISSNDGLVAEDYYKQGLAINRVLAREEHAAALGVTATVLFSEARDHVKVSFSGATPPPTLRLAIRGARAAADRKVVLPHRGGGFSEASLEPPPPGRWPLAIEDGAGSWRLDTMWQTSRPAVSLKASR